MLVNFLNNPKRAGKASNFRIERLIEAAKVRRGEGEIYTAGVRHYNVTNRTDYPERFDQPKRKPARSRKSAFRDAEDTINALLMEYRLIPNLMFSERDQWRVAWHPAPPERPVEVMKPPVRAIKKGVPLPEPDRFEPPKLSVEQMSELPQTISPPSSEVPAGLRDRIQASESPITKEEAYALISLLDLAEHGLLWRVIRCKAPDCRRFFYAKFPHQKFCLTVCQLRTFKADPLEKEKHRTYMRNHRQVTKHLDEIKKTLAKRRNKR